MNTAQLVIVCVTILLLAAITAAVVLARVGALSATRTPGTGPFDVEIGSNVAVHLGDGQSLRGTLVNRTADGLVLDDTSVISAGQTTQVGGLAHVPASKVTLLQEL